LHPRLASIKDRRAGEAQRNPPFVFPERYLRAVFAFIGMEDVEIVRAEGSPSGKQREAAMQAALAAIPFPVIDGPAPASKRAPRAGACGSTRRLVARPSSS
jgi:hypothetical protein